MKKLSLLSLLFVAGSAVALFPPKDAAFDFIRETRPVTVEDSGTGSCADDFPPVHAHEEFPPRR